MLKKKDISYYQKLAGQGEEEKALEHFVKYYVIPVSRNYSDILKTQANKALNVLSDDSYRDLSIRVSSGINAYKTEITDNYKQFMAIFNKSVFQSVGVRSPAVKKAIRDNTVNLFIERVEGALSQTQTSILSSIRQLQKDLIVRNQRIDAMRKAGDLLAKEVTRFKEQLTSDILKRNPEFTKMIDNDGFIIYRDGSRHRLEDYAEMATRTTTLNVERNAVEIKEAINNRLVAEYIVRDPRITKTDREICKKILSRKFYGKSIVALDRRIAEILQCVYLPDAIAQGAFGPNCRHSIQNVGKDYYNKIEEILFFADFELVVA